MTGKLLSIAILATALVAGVALYYLQVYHFYDEVEPAGQGDVQMTVRASGVPEAVPYDGFRAIDAESSPIRYRACFTTSASLDALSEAYLPYDAPVPLEAPGWFDCFDAGAIAGALAGGRARAFLGQAHIEYGIDRVVAVADDGRGFVWHQINHCGEAVFDGRPAPEDCPEPPEGY